MLFDLDGTLVDSLRDLAAALNRVLEERGTPPLAPAEVRGMIGDGTKMLVARGLAARGLPESLLAESHARFLALYEAAPATMTRPYPGVRETLARLVAEGLRLAICTNKPLAATRALLAALALDGCFPVVVGGDSLPSKKPDPAPLLLALGRLGSSPAAAVMVGDNEHDASAAEAAGLPFVLMTYGYARRPFAEIPAARRLADFAALPAALAALG